MKRAFRLTQNEDFRRVRRDGRSFAHPFMVLILTPAEPSVLRMGIAASRSVGNAVKRNRAKRRIRACLQKYLPVMCPGFDMVFLARKPVVDADFGDIILTVEALLSKAGVLKKQGQPQGNDGIGLPE